VTVGEPITRTITIRAEGLSAAQITPLPVPEGNSYRGYPDQPQLDELVTLNGLVATRAESMALVPNQAGEIVLPAVELFWWDVKSNQQRTARLPSTTLKVSPNLNTPPVLSDDSLMPAAMNTLATEVTKPKLSFMTTLSLGLNAVLIALLVALLINRNDHIPTARSVLGEKSTNSALLTLKQQLRAIEIEAKNENLMGMRDTILLWGKTLFADNPPITLKSLGNRLKNPTISELFTQLDQQLYRGKHDSSATLDIKLLIASLKKESDFNRKSTGKNKSGKALQSLYPD